jgi:hypothetical protein
VDQHRAASDTPPISHPPPHSVAPYWSIRLQNGDASAWREMLVGRAAGEVDETDILGQIENDDRWLQSD